MKFKLSTLFCVVLMFSLAIAWYAERKRFVKSSSKWLAEKQQLQQKFNDDLGKSISGSHLINRADVATEYMWLIRDLTDVYKVPYEETNGRVNRFVVQGIIDDWRGRDDIQFSMNLSKPEESLDWSLEGAKVWWALGSIKSSREFFEIAKKETELHYADVDSAEFDSLRELVEIVAKTTKPHSRF